MALVLRIDLLRLKGDYVHKRAFHEMFSQRGAVKTPNWNEVYAGQPDTKPSRGTLAFVTVETLRLAASAIRESQSRDAYHNYQAALEEIEEVLKHAQGE